MKIFIKKDGSAYVQVPTGMLCVGSIADVRRAEAEKNITGLINSAIALNKFFTLDPKKVVMH